MYANLERKALLQYNLRLRKMRASMKSLDVQGRLVGLGQALRRRRMEHVLSPVLCSWIRTALLCSLLWKSLFNAFTVRAWSRDTRMRSICSKLFWSTMSRHNWRGLDSTGGEAVLCGIPFAV